MAIKKYINTGELAGLTGCLDDEIRELAKKGVLPAHKTRKGHWRFNVDAAEKFFGIQINKPEVVLEEATADNLSKCPSGTRLITNKEHYDEVVKRICEAKSSVKIMTANFKRFRLKPTAIQGKNYTDGTPFIGYLMKKAVKGVSVQIICSKPSKTFTEEYQEYYHQMGKPKLFEYKIREGNHAKIYIVDDKIAYIGSANVTKAGIRQLEDANYEAGILTDNPELVSSILDFFLMAWAQES